MRSLFVLSLVVVTLLALSAPTAVARPIGPLDVQVGEIDLRWMTACLGPWGHEERTTVGPVTIVRYVCDDPGT